MKIITCIVAFTCLSMSAQAGDKVYKWVAEDGTVIYSDVPPPGDIAEELELPEQPEPTAPSPSTQRQLQRQAEQIDKRIEQRIAKRDAVLKELDEVRAQIARLKQALDEGKEPQPGEIQRLVGGGTRLKPSYFERIERQEKELAALEQRISGLLDELQQLR